ncbi:FxsA family protein, partial [Glaesserella parasuis]|nr:FxsA family protein [Glaesserella parasuis]MDE3945616.1 FxsA family protein [Glaesserella parasuis]MDE3956031.1 FxsA family protein [Glaesserella parasuis]MDE3968617.1 FxsA family protein [Glaesserella parasuis]MDE3971017.1 FxsA family protein [Glaesserella parasuis]
MPLLLFLAGLFLYIYIEISLLVSVGSAIGVLPLILLM